MIAGTHTMFYRSIRYFQPPRPTLDRVSKGRRARLWRIRPPPAGASPDESSGSLVGREGINVDGLAEPRPKVPIQVPERRRVLEFSPDSRRVEFHNPDSIHHPPPERAFPRYSSNNSPTILFPMHPKSTPTHSGDLKPNKKQVISIAVKRQLELPKGAQVEANTYKPSIVSTRQPGEDFDYHEPTRLDVSSATTPVRPN